MRRLFRFTGPLPNLPPRYNVAPTQQVPIVRRARDDGDRKLAQARWGVVPFWAKDEKIGYKLINARAEGIDAKPSFREAFKCGRRCPIPGDGFYEWAKETKPKQPWHVTLKDDGPFAFAGLWERWEKAPEGVPVESCTIITTAANQLLRPLHGRYVTFQLAEVAVSRQMFQDILRLIARLRAPPAAA